MRYNTYKRFYTYNIERMAEMYDVIIIGKGPAGLSAALYTIRSNLETLIIGKNDSRLKKAARIENYFGFSEPVSGEKLLEEGEKQVKRLGGRIVEDEVISLEKGEYIKVITANQEYLARSVIIATGQQTKKIDIGKITEFEGRGVSYCSTCDGFFYRNLKVGVLGYRDYAVHEAVELLSHTNNITIYTNGMDLDVREIYRDAEEHFRINRKPIEKVDGGDFLERIHFKDGTIEEIDGLFVAYESASAIDFARKLGIITEGNDVKVDSRQRTNIEGVFAAGDCTGGLKQVATAVGEGAVAARSVSEYLREIKTKEE